MVLPYGEGVFGARDDRRRVFIDGQHPARVCYFRVVREWFMLFTILGR